MHICKFCGRQGKTYKSNWIHQSRCIENPERFVQIPWNKSLTGDTRCKHSEETKKKLSISATGKASTEEKEKLRIEKIKEKSKNNGGLRPGSGRGKSGWYKGFYCRSSWELAYVIYNTEHNIEIKPCTEIRYYTWENKKRRYYPDFIVCGKIVEIKGYITEQWKQKHIENPDVQLLTHKDIKHMIDYVKEKYGNEYTEMYE